MCFTSQCIQEYEQTIYPIIQFIYLQTPNTKENKQNIVYINTVKP